MKVLSLFDGMACGLQALKNAGIAVTEYHSFEIDQHAIKIAMKNHPEIIQHGDVIDADFKKFEGFDLVIGGSPCQGFSFAGKQLAFDDPRSKLYFEFLRALKEVKPKHFLLENVVMKKIHQDVINETVGVYPVKIDSALVNAQTRNRLYWANFHIPQPEDKKITWGDVREHGVNATSYYYTEAAMQWLAKHSQRKNKVLRVHSDSEKMQMLEASMFKKYSAQRFFGIVDIPSDESAVASMRGRRIDPQSLRRDDYNKGLAPIQHIEFIYDGKTNCLSTVSKDNVVVPFTLPYRLPVDAFFFRYLTVTECERLMGLPDGYTDGVSNTQRYKMLGNGWEVNTITHIFSQLKNGE